LPRGGHRPGAAEGPPRRGAPKGNLNALKTGRYSRQFQAAIDAMAGNDEIRPILRAIMQHKHRERVRFQALMIVSAKLIQNARLSAVIRRKLEQYLESECAHPESEEARKNN
jgi:hypothetical protein